MPLIKARSSSIMDSVDLRGQPTAETAAQTTNTNQLASTAFVRTAIAELIDSSPELLNTLNELAAAIGDDPSFATTVANSIATKVPLDGSVAMTGELTLSGAPTQNLSAVTKQYVDQAIDDQMIYSTDDVPEGQNLYYTDSRVRSAVSLASDNTVVLDYDSSTGQFTYTHPTSDGILEGSTNQYFTQARARQSISMNSDDGTIISYSSITGEITFTTPDTDKIVEGQTNLYFQTSRARASINNGANINYDSATGTISTQAAVWSVNGQEHDVVLDTDNIEEGSSNQYFTQERARGSVSLTTDDSNILSYSSGTGVFTFVTPTTDAIDEGQVNQYFTNERVRAAVSASGDISYNSATGNFSYSTPTTDGVNEGSTNQYFTQERARNSVSLTSDNSDVLSYDNTTGVFTFSLGSQTTDDVQEGEDNLYFTTARARESISATGWQISYSSATGVIDVATPSTDDVAEGATNQYFLTSRARDSVSAVDAGGDGSFSYDSATGVFTYTGPDASEVRAHLSATTSTGAQYDSATGTISLSSIPNSSLTNDSVTVNGSTVALGGSVSFGTDSVTEEDNLYFTEGRARAAISLTSDNTSVLDYDSLTGEFTFSLSSQTTDDVAEGATNQYFTTQRARDSVSAVDAGGDGSFSYDSATGAFTYTGPSASEVRAHLSATSASGVSYDSATGTFSLASIPNSSLTNSSISFNGKTISLGGSDTLTTDDISEGSTNQYYTSTRVRNELSAVDSEDVGAFSYNSNTGAFTFDASAVVATVNGESGYVTLDTDDIGEGSGNLYYTTARTRADVGAGTGVSYNQSTGVFSIGQAVGTTDNVTFNDVTVSGDLTVNGTLTTINSTELTVTDKNITIADGAADAAAANGAGITVDGANATITYASATDSWNFNKDVSIDGGLTITDSLTAPTFVGDLTGDVTGTVSDISNHNTDALAEGTTNQYFTDTRARNAVSLTSDKTSVLSYNASTGTFTFAIANASTSDIAEGSNQYFTNTRARDAISVSDLGGDGSLSYDSATGVITYTGPNASEVRAHLSATSASGVSYDSATGTISLSGIPNSSLTNSSVTVNGATVSLGGSTSFGTDSVTEESNLYFTQTRARDSLSITTSDSSVFDYNSTTGEFTFNLAGLDTSEVTEDPAATTSSGTMYFTDARARAALSAVDAGGDGSFSYDSATGVFTYTGPDASEVRAHFNATSASGITYDNSTGTFALASIPNSSLISTTVTINGTEVTLGGSGSFGTDSVTEEGNLYYTDTRSRAALSVAGGAGGGSGTTYGPFNSMMMEFTSVSVNTMSATPTITISDSMGSLATLLASGDLGAGTTVTLRDMMGTNYDVTLGSGFTSNSPDPERPNISWIANLQGSVPSGIMSINRITFVTAGSGGGSGPLTYDSTSGVFTFTTPDTDAIEEGSTNLYFTQTRARDSISVDGWQISYNSGTGVISMATPTTSDVSEGSNQYFTNARARQAISLTTDNTDAMSYDNTTGTFTFTLNSVDTDEIAEGQTNLYFQTSRARNSISNGSNIDYDASTGIISTQAAVWSVNGQEHAVVLDTDDISEGSSNVYFTDARARSAITLTTDDSNVLSYNSGTGAFTFVKPTTDGISEGSTNLYFTNERADDRIAAASIRDLSDVNKTEALQDGYTLVWSSALGEFVPQNVAVTATTLNFTGDGTETSFSTGVEVTSIDNTQVFINGLIQAPTYSYTISTTNGVTSIVFDTAPEANDYIFVRVSSTSTLTAGGVLNESSQIDGGTF